MPRSRKQKLDLPRKIMLRMTEDDVTNAICNSRKYCAIARTIYRQMEVPIGRVRVSQAGASIAKGEYRDLQCGNFDAAGVWVEHGPPPRNCSDPLRAVLPGADIRLKPDYHRGFGVGGDVDTAQPSGPGGASA